MIDKALAGLNPQGGESYYFQLYPLNLSIIGKDSEVPAPGTTYRFTILKGTYCVIQVSKNLIRTNWQLMLISRR